MKMMRKLKPEGLIILLTHLVTSELQNRPKLPKCKLSINNLNYCVSVKGMSD